MTAGPATVANASVKLLRKGAAYPDRPESVELIETEFSWVFLTDRFAYKLKKPVRFEFLDYSSGEQRHRASQEELHVNQGLAPDVYLAVLPITRSSRGRLQLNGGGRPVDWVLKMRRLPSERSLRNLLIRRQLRSLDLDAVARRLALHYSRQPPLTVRPDSYRRHLAQQVRNSQSDLLAHLPSHVMSIQQIHGALLRYLAQQSQQFDRRVCDGRVLEGHGDLRPDHIYVLTPPVVIDAVEYSKPLRQVDIVDEFSALAMECEKLGFPQIGRELLTQYGARTGDRPSEPLLAFYKTCHASFRARFQILSAARRPCAGRCRFLQEAEAYLALATQYLSHFDRPWRWDGLQPSSTVVGSEDLLNSAGDLPYVGDEP